MRRAAEAAKRAVEEQARKVREAAEAAKRAAQAAAKKLKNMVGDNMGKLNAFFNQIRDVSRKVNSLPSQFNNVKRAFSSIFYAIDREINNIKMAIITVFSNIRNKIAQAFAFPFEKILRQFGMTLNNGVGAVGKEVEKAFDDAGRMIKAKPIRMPNIQFNFGGKSRVTQTNVYEE